MSRADELKRYGPFTFTPDGAWTSFYAAAKIKELEAQLAEAERLAKGWQGNWEVVNRSFEQAIAQRDEARAQGWQPLTKDVQWEPRTQVGQWVNFKWEIRDWDDFETAQYWINLDYTHYRRSNPPEVKR